MVVQPMLGMLRRPSLRFGNNGRPHFFYLFLLDETLELAIPRGFASDALVGMTAKQELEITASKVLELLGICCYDISLLGLGAAGR